LFIAIVQVANFSNNHHTAFWAMFRGESGKMNSGDLLNPH